MTTAAARTARSASVTGCGSVENVNGGAGADVLIGIEVNSQLRGNLGVDQLRGGDGLDVLRAKDGVRDQLIDRGAGTDAEAVRDAIDPAPISCPLPAPT